MRISVDKHSEIEASYRKYNGRVAFLGYTVVDQFHDEATFRDMGSSLATLEVAKAADFYGCLHVLLRLLTMSRHMYKVN